MVQLQPPTQELAPTGFESKSFKTIIENWLYHPEFQVRVDAMIEMRKRFRKTYKFPDWMIGEFNKTHKEQ